MLTVKQMGIPYGVAITASHNPAIYNGIKIFTEGGRDAEAAVIRKIEAEIALLIPEERKTTHSIRPTAIFSCGKSIWAYNRTTAGTCVPAVMN